MWPKFDSYGQRTNFGVIIWTGVLLLEVLPKWWVPECPMRMWRMPKETEEGGSFSHLETEEGGKDIFVNFVNRKIK